MCGAHRFGMAGSGGFAGVVRERELCGSCSGAVRELCGSCAGAVRELRGKAAEAVRKSCGGCSEKLRKLMWCGKEKTPAEFRIFRISYDDDSCVWR